jgi:phosphoribosylformylglycinamidine cyclo-ligase
MTGGQPSNLNSETDDHLTYGKAGVDRKVVRKAQNAIGDIISATHKFPSPSNAKVLSGFGHYAGLMRIGRSTIAIHTDGVGTKVMVAQMVGRFDTVGIDCVAMNVNDIICVGARPIGFIDYIALRTPNEVLVREIAKGLVAGARQAAVAIVGGETAILPDLISGDENAFDLAGMILGSVEGKPVMGDKVRAGDIVLGIESSGLHSNGYTLARKVLLSKYSVDDTAQHLVQTVGEDLLTPTRIYVKPVVEALKTVQIHGLAHITGGAFAKLARLNEGVDYYLDDLPEPYGIFKQIQIDGKISIKEMYRTFNMGIGFCIIVPKESIDGISRIFAKHRMRCTKIGRIEKGRGRVIAKLAGRNEVLS